MTFFYYCNFASAIVCFTQLQIVVQELRIISSQTSTIVFCALWHVWFSVDTLFRIGYRWITQLLALGCYALLLMPGFLQGLLNIIVIFSFLIINNENVKLWIYFGSFQQWIYHHKYSYAFCLLMLNDNLTAIPDTWLFYITCCYFSFHLGRCGKFHTQIMYPAILIENGSFYFCFLSLTFDFLQLHITISPHPM